MKNEIKLNKAHAEVAYEETNYFFINIIEKLVERYPTDEKNFIYFFIKAKKLVFFFNDSTDPFHTRVSRRLGHADS